MEDKMKIFLNLMNTKVIQQMNWTLIGIGIPAIEYFSDRIHLSGNYLSDLLKKETGYSAKDQINNFVVEKAKTLLLGEQESISSIAYTLGFNYPHYFSRLFKSKTGKTPQEYRKITLNH
jgi:YesN/AraC family two-component response regulator